MSRILVTGIGGNVGYGIIRNIRCSYPNIEIIGINTARISAGNHMCDEVYEAPFSTNPAYIPFVKDICNKHDIALIIPSTDYETYVLAANAGELPPVAVSPAETTKIFLDKYLSYTTFRDLGLNFAESVLPSDYVGQYAECIVKPREGRGSRGLHFNPPKPLDFSDDYIVQPLLQGKEITTAFYVTKNNELHGLITLDRELSSGATNICEVVTDYDDEIKKYLLDLIQKVTIRGACNLQCMVNENGFTPFEVNCRISGTNSIRSQFGFKDVSYTIDEYLYNKTPETPIITKGTAIRILHDIIYPGIARNEVNNNKDKFYIYE